MIVSDSKLVNATQADTVGRSQNANILVIDDAADELRLLNDVLTRAGYDVRSTRDGKSGLRAARLLRPDVILLDIKLPGSDGFEVCQQLKEDSFLTDIPVIFISGLSDVASHIRGFEVGGRDFINKPFHEVEVLVRVQNQLAIVALQREQVAHGQLQERHRIARELHDSVNQTLFMLGSVAQSLSLTEPHLTPKLADNLDYLHKLSQTALAEMRLLLIELGPEVLHKTPLERLLNQLVGLLQTRTDITFCLRLQDTDQVDKDHVRKETVYRITREALFNAVKHAEAKNIHIEVVGSGRSGHLFIEDDGIGFDDLSLSASGSGISNMHERAIQAHMALNIDTIRGGGTTVRATWTNTNEHE